MAEQPKARRRNTREELIKAGVEEINRYGVAGFFHAADRPAVRGVLRRAL